MQAAFNHGSVHRAGFLNEHEIFAASHDEKLALYDITTTSTDEEGQTSTTGAAMVDFGDVREVLGCRYLAGVGVKRDGRGAVVGVGGQE